MAAACDTDSWKVFISAESANLDKIYLFSPDTPLYQILESWKKQCGAFGNYVFKSDDKTEEYDIDFTLREIGETKEGSRKVLFCVDLSDFPTAPETRNIYIKINGRCRHYSVRPYYRLKSIVPNSKNMIFQHNGICLDKRKTIRQLKIPENGLITGIKAISVQLADVSSREVHLPDEAVTCHLKKELRSFEKNDFLLKTMDTFLREDELVGFKGPLEIIRPECKVTVGNQTFHWCVNGGKFDFQDLTGYLANVSGISRRELARLTYTCEGCGRRVKKDEQGCQLLNIDCCRSRSMTLKTEEIREGENAEDLLNCLQAKYLKLLAAYKLLEEEQAASHQYLSTLGLESKMSQEIAYRQTALPIEEDRSNTLQEANDDVKTNFVGDPKGDLKNRQAALPIEEDRSKTLQEANDDVKTNFVGDPKSDLKNLQGAEECEQDTLMEASASASLSLSSVRPTITAHLFLGRGLVYRPYNLKLPQPTTVGDLRRSIARKLKQRPDRTKIRQWTALSRSSDVEEPLFWASEGTRGYLFELHCFYISADGERFNRKKVKRQKLRHLDDDDEDFFIPKERSLCLDIIRVNNITSDSDSSD